MVSALDKTYYIFRMVEHVPYWFLFFFAAFDAYFSFSAYTIFLYILFDFYLDMCNSYDPLRSQIQESFNGVFVYVNIMHIAYTQ